MGKVKDTGLGVRGLGPSLEIETLETGSAVWGGLWCLGAMYAQQLMQVDLTEPLDKTEQSH